MDKKLIGISYYIKNDGVVKEATKEEYEEFLNKLKKEKKDYICPNCRVCDCEKIRYTNIYKSEEVNIGTFIRKKYNSYESGNVYRIKDDIFRVYDCNRFEIFKEILLKDEIITKNQILLLDEKIVFLELKTNIKNDEKIYEKIEKLKESRDEKIKLLHDKDIISELEKEEKQLKEKIIKYKAKQLKLENNQK